MLIPNDDILAAAARIKDLSPATPLVYSHHFSSKLRTNIYFKLEVLNPTHSFKTRGAANAILSLNESKRAKGVITASGGNHGLGLAHIARRLGIPALIYLPGNTPQSKVEAFEAYDVRTTLAGESWDECNQSALATAELQGMTYIHPFDDPSVMAGQATIGMEILQELDGMDAVIASIGGGGLIAGVTSAVMHQSPGTRIYGVETIGADSMTQSYKNGRITALPAITSIANTLGARTPGERAYEIVREYVSDVQAVSDAEAVAALLDILENEKLLVEPAMSCCLAALTSGKIPSKPNENVVVIVCGGNATLSDVDRWRRQFDL